MWKYIRQYLPYAILAALFMVGEVLMDLLQPTIMGVIVDDGVLGLNNNGIGNLTLIWIKGAQMILLVLFGGFCGSANNVFSHLTAQNVGNEIRKDAFRNIMAFSFPQRDRFGTGSLVTRMTNDITQIQNFVSTFVRGIVRNSLLTIGSIYCMFRLDVHFGILVLCALPFMFATLVICLRKGTPLFSVLQDQLDELNEIMQEDVNGIRIIKACVRELYEKARFGKANGALIRTQLKVLIIFAFMNPVVSALMYLVVAGILWMGAFDVSSGITSPGNVMAAITYTTQLLHGIMMMVMIFQNISRGYASWKRVRVVLQTEPEIQDGAGAEIASQVKAQKNTDSAGSISQVKVQKNKGEIEFRDVSFSYPGSDHPVLSHISLHIHPGETVAFMGATGCGKSTLVNLIPRFYDTTEGEILVEQVNIRDYKLKELRDKIAIALQRSELFSMEIAENIAWGNPVASEEEIQAAAHTAQAEDFISSTADGFHTLVAERGMSLSGGQKQRISIARAVLKSSEILIFDDSTSALDLKTEANLHQALRQSSPESTKIIIAQRIASVRNADRIFILENGQIAAEGTHEQLLKISPTYQEIYHSQIMEEAPERSAI
ncbi:MAG: ABC transporter ATP-binding protein/permease [Clostridiales bacterium]|nr:ABC transporter ATP-binding protein/permease [Clostridiales bacterium]